MFFLEYLTSIYFLPLITTIIGLIIVCAYDKFEKKQYTSAVYLRIGLLIYVSTFGTIYISRLPLFSNAILGSHSGGGIDSQTMMPQPNELTTSHLEQFKTGVPTF